MTDETINKTNINSCQLSVLIAAYSEAANLIELLPKLQTTIQNLTENYEIIVIDTQYPVDDTMQVCKNNGVICIPRRGGNNYGDAIRTGIDASKGEYIITMDADGSHNPKFIPLLWGKRATAGVIIASRYISGGKTDNPWLLVSLSRLLNLAFERLIHMPVLDVSNSFRLYKGDLLRKQHLKGLHFDILEEILVKIAYDSSSYPASIIELPYHFEQRKHGKSKRNLFVFGVIFLAAIFRLRKIRDNHLAERTD